MVLSSISFAVLILIFVLGLVLIVKGGDAFVDAASWIAVVSGIPHFVIGATIVSLATTMPEMLVSVFAALRGSVDMAVGNAVGSITANTGLILAVALLAMPGPAPRRSYLVKSLLLIGAVATLLVFTRWGTLSWVGSVLLVLIFFFNIAESLHAARLGREAAEHPASPARREVLQNLALFFLGAAGIVAGAELLIDTALEMAARLLVPEIVVAVTIVAVGTSLPELVTTITAILKKQTSLSAGNIIGANIIDTALILPICGAMSRAELPISRQSLALDFPVCMLCVLIALVPPLFTQKFQRWQGAVLLAVYAGYLMLVLRFY